MDLASAKLVARQISKISTQHNDEAVMTDKKKDGNRQQSGDKASNRGRDRASVRDLNKSVQGITLDSAPPANPPKKGK
ncbi:hypothetical protein [Spongiibacter sp. UBA1325]|uniref:hypothetical protein n=1 Tax=Spongiibacter sp. UBA1325 TaxID=1947543 RepID=UPI00257C203A|nr:hypothetical protein [Spongiibacter sp. UBA1325]|tara:strand:+ start:59 stop:292 length:234 start_codon:yes stop_codon:yes gene_type:complete